jgi:branched-chain amino acid transport system ATP-binding protein
MALLEVRNLTKNFGGLTAVDRLDFEVNEGEILGMIGPNGAGKTTVFNLISGIYPPDEGEIRLSDHPAVPQPDGHGERHGRTALPHQGWLARGHIAAQEPTT